MASNEIAGAKEKGVYSFMKHFALNDQETNRTNMVCTWANEQSIRETYLKPFEMSVKEGGAQAVMSSFNYIGYTYAGASSNLLQTVLRGEWGFKGFVLTDYFRRLRLPERRSGSACGQRFDACHHEDHQPHHR